MKWKMQPLQLREKISTVEKKGKKSELLDFLLPQFSPINMVGVRSYLDSLV